MFNVKNAYPAVGGSCTTQAGARGDDDPGYDDALAINCAIQAATLPEFHGRGGVVYLPPGVYRLKTAVNVIHGTTLMGSGAAWSDFGSSFYRGTLLHVVSPVDHEAITVVGVGASIRDIAIYHDQPSGGSWSPSAWPFAIKVDGTDHLLRDLLLVNPTYGILIGSNGQSTGRITIEGIRGQPIKVGIKVNSAVDVVHVRNIHFGLPEWNPASGSIRIYLLQNATGILSLRNDSPIFEDIFMINQHYGFYFGNNTTVDPMGATSEFRIANFNCDNCWEGIHIESYYTSSAGDAVVTGQVVNAEIYGVEPADVAGSTGIHVVDSKNALLQLQNVRINKNHAGNIFLQNSCTPTTTCTGPNPSTVLLSNFVGQNWSYGAAGCPWASLHLDRGTEVRLAWPTLFNGGSCTNTSGGWGAAGVRYNPTTLPYP